MIASFEFMYSECAALATNLNAATLPFSIKGHDGIGGVCGATLDEKIEHNAYRMGRIMIYPYHRVVTCDGAIVKVGSTLFNLLVLFIENIGVTLSRQDLIEGAWVQESSQTNMSTYIGQGRDLLGQESIVNVFGKGYKAVFSFETVTGKDAIPPGSVVLPRIIRLDRPLYPLIGRERELAELEDLIRDHKLVALIGPCGIGKTRLATELGWQVSRQLPDGAAMVDLAPLKEMKAVVSALARALDLPLQATDTPLESIADALRERQMMIIFDNCEHITLLVVEIIKVLQARAPKLRLLVTSQHVLEGPAQEVYWLKGLALPPESETDPAKIAEYGAIRLFLDHAHSGDQRFVFDADNAADVVEICRRLDGVPQMLRIAASRMLSIGPRGLCERLNERFGLLRLGEGAAVKRHLSLLDMVEWAYELLIPPEQGLFCRLGIFPSWFTAWEAVTIAGEPPSETLDGLIALEKKSLVLRQGGNEPRFRLLETSRIYATMRLGFTGERKLLVERHLRYFLEEFIKIEAKSDTAPDAELRAIYARQIDNIRMALDTALADPALAQTGIALAGVSGRQWYMLGLVPEGLGYSDKFIALIDKTTEPADVARILRYAASLCRDTDRLRSVKLFKRSAAIYRKLKDRLNLGAVLALLGGSCVFLGRHAEAKRALDEAWDLLVSSDHKKSLWNIVNSRGLLASIQNDTDEAYRHLLNARHFASKMNDVLRENITLFNLGELEWRRGAIQQAKSYARKSADNLRAANELRQMTRPLTNLASYLILSGDYAEARLHATEGLRLLIEERGHWFRLRLQVWAPLLARDGDIAAAARIYGWSCAEYARTGEIREPTEQALCDLLLTLFKAHPKPEEIEAWIAEGAEWTEKDAIEFAMNHIVSPAR
jgi:predicted ATPase/DNA-binding winged helix-turn-helix (wHTH) protein